MVISEAKYVHPEFNIDMGVSDSEEACELFEILLIWRLIFIFDINVTSDIFA